MQNPPVLPSLTAKDSLPASELRIELETRITTQPLHYRSGDEEAALQSVHALFASTRKLLVAHPQAGGFGVAATFVLNSVLRPYTARWHRWLVEERFADERARRQFRYELTLLQTQLRRFVELLRLMGDPANQLQATTRFHEIAVETPEAVRAAKLGTALAAGIGPEVKPRMENFAGQSEPFVTADTINQAEWKFIRHRREALAGQTPGEMDQEAPIKNATGLCLSGGGIRSATFCLGIVQVLARQKLLPQFDYLSTVSGGGYLGTFLTSYLGTPSGGLRDKEQPFNQAEMHAALDRTFKPEGSRESAAVRHLRNNSRFLLNGGPWGRVRAGGLLITGILTNILIMLPLPLVAALLVVGLKRMGFWEVIENPPPIFASSCALTVLLWLACGLAVMWLALPVVRNQTRGAAPGSAPAKLRNIWETLALVLGLLTISAGVLALMPGLLGLYSAFRSGTLLPESWFQKLLASEKLLGALAGFAPVVLGLLAARLKSGGGKKWMSLLFAVSGPLLFLVVFFAVGARLFDGEWNVLHVLIPTALMFCWGWLAMDINDFSPHDYYRARLCECYLAAHESDQKNVLNRARRWLLHGTRRQHQAAQVGTLFQLPLSRSNQTGAAPYHLVNTAANLPMSREPNLRGRDCDFFVFSRYFCGSPVCGYVPTTALERLDPHLDLGTAMALSGAAAAPNAGVTTVGNLRFLMVLLNVRLGYWLRNPAAGPRRLLNAPGPFYLFREMTGWMHENSDYVNLSDGGHIENLALYELLRRRCKFIVVVDGGMEPQMDCADLRLVQRYAQIDFGIRFDPDVEDLALDGKRRTRAYGVLGKIQYEARDAQDDGGSGWLLYLKLACTGGEPGYVADYRRQNPDFPHQPTSDQIYDEAQFEAYRRLGECVAESLFRGELSGHRVNPMVEGSSTNPGESLPYQDLQGLFQALANNFLPDNDPAFDS